MYLSSGAWYSKVLDNGDDNYGEIYRRVFKQLGLSLFVPMAIGQVVKNLFPKPTKKVFMDWKMSKLASIALLTLIWQTFDQAFRSGAFDSVKPSNIVFIIFISIALYFIWLGICFSASIIWLPRKDTIACCYCCPAKALAMVVSVSSVMFINISPIEQSKLQIPAIIYQALQVSFTGAMSAGHMWMAFHDRFLANTF
jgi:sodium/bile acid cotransporter 7